MPNLPTPTVSTPFYLDWTFWAVVVASVALLLSQLPPIRLWFKPARLKVEIHGRANISHQIGNPNIGLHVSLGNTGGRELNINSINIKLSRDGRHLVSLPIQSYFEKPTDQTSVLFVPLLLKPGERWLHGANFLNFFERNDEKLFRKSRAALRENIEEKRRQGDEGDGKAVKAEPELVAPFLQLFQRLYRWNPGEYVIELAINVSPNPKLKVEQYHFTLFESDEYWLEKHTDDYKYGASVYFDTDEHSGVLIPLNRHAR